MGKIYTVYTDHTSNLYRALAIFDCDRTVVDCFLLDGLDIKHR